MPSLRVTMIEQRVHVGRVKLFMLHVRKVSLDIGQVVVDAVTLCSRVDPQDVAVPDVVDHRRDRPAADTQEPAVDRRPVRVEPTVADDVRMALAGEFHDRRFTRIPRSAG